jgi:putative nucleotidyltransferase with HDIG domain
MNNLIYIVDDKAEMRDMLQMILQSGNPAWEVRGFGEPGALIAAVAERPPDMVISDFSMPGMKGTELQDKIREISPSTIRLLLSGGIPNLSRIASAHQFIAKPFQMKEVITVVTNSLRAQEWLRQHPRLGDIISGLRSLPVVPAVFHRLIGLLDQDNSSTDEIAQLLAKDGGIMTRIIQLSNSSLFNHGAAVTSPEEAILCLGLQNIKAVVLSLHVFDSYGSLGFPEAPVQGVWLHCLETAQLAEELCRKMQAREDATNAFLAGLLHDLGQLVLMENARDQYRQVYQQAAAGGRPLQEVEHEILGLRSAEISAFLIALWGMPAAAADAIASHRAPWETAHPKFNAADALYVANILARRKHCPDHLETPALDEDYLKSIGAAEAINDWVASSSPL